MTTYFKAKCHCGLNHFKVALETSRLPYPTDLCHCTSCRHGSGQMCINDVFIVGVPLQADTPEGVDEPADLDGLIKYRSSARATRYSCKKCFAKFFFVVHGEHWGLFTGLFEDGAWVTVGERKKAVEIVEHVYVEATLDGGIADIIREVNGKRLLRHPGYSSTGDAEVEVGWKAEEMKTKHQRKDSTEDALPFSCLCKTISFKLIRPTTMDGGENEKLYPGRQPDDPIRFHASHCFCTSCRLTCGSPISSWVCVASRYIIDNSTSLPLGLEEESKRPKGLVQYESSPGVYREGCRTCGASVFYWAKTYPRVDICAGLLDEEVDGARAEGWLCWSKTGGYPEDAVEPGLVQALQEGLQVS